MRMVIVRDLSNIYEVALAAVKAGTVLQLNGWSVGPYQTATGTVPQFAVFGPNHFEMTREAVTIPFGFFYHKVGLLGLADAADAAGII
jgi:hypothetical protein